MNVYPEHEKMKAVSDESQVIGAFLDWIQNEREPTLQLCSMRTIFHGADVRFTPTQKSIEQILADYFNINLEKIELEKRAMLEEMRKTNRKWERGLT